MPLIKQSTKDRKQAIGRLRERGGYGESPFKVHLSKIKYILSRKTEFFSAEKFFNVITISTFSIVFYVSLPTLAIYEVRK
jgi:hypothetical protein